MAIAVNCPHCSAAFSVKDESADTRAKCPTCKEPLTIPSVADTVHSPGPAKPVLASRPQAAAVHEADEDSPKPERRRDEDEADDDARRSKKRREEEPRSRRRRDEDDGPRSSRRRRNDGNKPKKKGSALPLALGIVAGVILLGGGCAGAYVLWFAPTAQKLDQQVQKDFDDKPKEMGVEDPGKPTEQKVRQVRVGMTQQEVEAVFGEPGKLAKRADTEEVVREVIGANLSAWNTATREGRVFVWGKGENKLLVAYDAQPGTRRGTVTGVVARLNGEGVDVVSLEGGPTDGPLELTAELLLAEFQVDQAKTLRRYAGKTIKVTGRLTTGVSTGESFYMGVRRSVLNKSDGTVQCYFDPADRGESKKLEVGSQATVVGIITSAEETNGQFVLKLSNCKVAK